MKKIFNKLGAMFLTVAMIIPASLSMPNVASATVNWNVTGNYVFNFNLGSDYSHDVSLVQDGLGNVTGNGGYPAGGSHVYTWVLTSGTISGNSIDFLANYTASADAVTPLTTMNVVGTIAPNGTMSGTWSDNYQGGVRNGTWSTTSGTATEVTATTVVVTGDTSASENLPGWLFNRDLSTATPYQFNNTQQSIGTGSLYIKPIGSNASDKFIGENFINSPISNIKSVSYDFRIGSGGTNFQAGQFYMSVYANFGVSDDLKYYDCRYNVVPTIGSTSGFTTVTFDPTQAYLVTTRTGVSASPFTCPSIPADMDSLSPGSNIRVFALNVGDTSSSDLGLDGYLDKVVVAAGNNVTTYDFEPIPTSTVTMCKVDSRQVPLSGWTLILKGDSVQSGLIVPTNISTGIDSNSLVAGTSYIAKSSGTWTNQGGANPVDSEYSTTDAWSTYMDGYTGYQTDILELQINNAFDPNSNWGVYNPTHTYAQSFTPVSNGPANFRIFDGTGVAQELGWFGDNNGTLSIDINKGFAGITGQDGCVTFTGVPYGNYSSDEIAQANWVNVSGIGSVSIDSPTKKITIVNRDTTLPTTGGLKVTKNTIGGNGTFNFSGVSTGLSITTAGNTGSQTVSGLVPGIYSVTESAQAGWVQTSNTCTNVSVAVGEIASCVVTNTKLSSISGTKYNDVNRNGKRDVGELGLAGWVIKLKVGNNILSSTTTDALGNYSFQNLVAGTYTVRETHKNGWKRMSKNPRPIVIASAGTDVTAINFGNAKKYKHEREDDDKDDCRDDQVGNYYPDRENNHKNDKDNKGLENRGR